MAVISHVITQSTYLSSEDDSHNSTSQFTNENYSKQQTILKEKYTAYNSNSSNHQTMTADLL